MMMAGAGTPGEGDGPGGDEQGQGGGKGTGHGLLQEQLRDRVAARLRSGSQGHVRAGTMTLMMIIYMVAW